MVLNTLLSWAQQYNECAARHAALVDVVTEAVKP
jgi:hypothetical protein